MKLKIFLSYIFNIRFIVKQTLCGEVPLGMEVSCLLFFYFYERALLFKILNIESRSPYFVNSSLLTNIFTFIGVIAVACLLKTKKIKTLINLYFNTFFACQFWTWLVFSIYLSITIPLNFYIEQNLLGEPWQYLSGAGYVLFNCLPFIFLIFGIINNSNQIKNETSLLV